MGRKVIVSLVSDQTIPNVLFIKEKHFADKYYFISTEKMERNYASNNILNALKLLDKKEDVVEIIEVVEDSLLDIDEKLVNKLLIEDDDDVLVNITGGTKIMSLGVYNFFSRNGAADIYYIPIGKNEVRQIFPLRKNRHFPLESRTTLFEYLAAYGVTVNDKSFASKNKLLKKEENTKLLFHHFIGEKRKELFINAEEIRKNNFRGKRIRRNNEAESFVFANAQFFTDYGVVFENEQVISDKETKYLTGEWFEEFLYPKIKRILNKNHEEIGMGVQLVKNGAPNEYDIIFTHNNSLYVIECKTDISDNEEGKISYLFTNTLYKAATLKKEFGLWVNYYLFAMNDFSKLKEEQRNRANLLGIKLVGLEVLANEKELDDYISKM